jgi:hypothetical protein
MIAMLQKLLIALIMMVVALSLWTPLFGEAGDAITRHASGEVVATDTKAIPNTIVIKTKNWKAQDFVVGASVEADTVIMVGNKRIQLKDIRIGDTIDITYERNLRVVAKTIKIKR